MIFITKGHYGKVPLEGLGLGPIRPKPGTPKACFESFGKWNFDYVYIDEAANEQQPTRRSKNSPCTSFRQAAQNARVSLRADHAQNRRGLNIWSQWEITRFCNGHLIEGGYNGAPKVVNPPLADPTHKEFLQGQTTKLTYTDAGQDWKYESSNYMRGKFHVDNKEYEKYEADMARKMAQMNSGK